MACEVIVDNISRENWERYADDFADYSIYQTWPYQQVRAEMDRQEVSRVVIKDENGHMVTMCQIRIKHVKPLGLKIGYIQWGPLLRRKNGKLNCNVAALEKLREAYLGIKVNVLRVVPNVFEDETGQEVVQMLEASGFEHVRNVTPYRTIMFPLDGSEEELKRKLHRGWRRNLKKAESAQLEIEQGCNSEYFGVLERLYRSALKRKGFKGLNPQEFERPQHVLSPREKMSVTIAYSEKRPVTALVTSNLGDTALDILAANDGKALECGSSFLVYWRAFCASKHAGMKRYDLGGIDPQKNPTVYEFKRRTGGEEVSHIGAFEAATNSIVKNKWRVAEKIYRPIKK